MYNYVNNNPLNIMDEDGLLGINEIADWGAGLGDNLTFGLTKQTRNAFGLGSVNTCSASYEVGEWTGVIAGIGTGWIAGTKQVAKATSGINWQNFSHSLISDSVLKKYEKSSSILIAKSAKWMKKSGNRLNGDHVPPGLHTRMDKKAQFGLPRQHKIDNPLFKEPRNSINRLPYVPGSIIYGITSERFNNE